MKKQKDDDAKEKACPLAPLMFEFFGLRALLIEKKVISEEEYKKFLEEGKKKLKGMLKLDAKLQKRWLEGRKIDYIG